MPTIHFPQKNLPTGDYSGHFSSKVADIEWYFPRNLCKNPQNWTIPFATRALLPPIFTQEQHCSPAAILLTGLSMHQICASRRDLIDIVAPS
ncbi:MAG: hypothetical protein Q4B13_08210 [Lautropia sp.]|nr:hypothetical protein [Lautropia sp.]